MVRGLKCWVILSPWQHLHTVLVDVTVAVLVESSGWMGRWIEQEGRLTSCNEQDKPLPRKDPAATDLHIIWANLLFCFVLFSGGGAGDGT